MRRLWFWEAGNVTEESYGLWLVLSTYLLDPVTPFVKVQEDAKNKKITQQIFVLLHEMESKILNAVYPKSSDGE